MKYTNLCEKLEIKSEQTLRICNYAKKIYFFLTAKNKPSG